jgi:hypothetical protein
MMTHPWRDDDALMADLAEAIRSVDPLTDRVAAFGRGAYSWRTIDQDLIRASLTFDSLLAPGSAHRTSGNEPRTLVFTATPLSVELEVQDDRALGQIIPPGPGQIVLDDVDGESTTFEADDLGFFIILPVPDKMCRLRLETGTGSMVTDWIRLNPLAG